MHFLSYLPPKFTKLFWAHFWDFHFASKRKKVLRAFSLFLRPKMKVLPMKFRRILEVLCLHVLQENFLAKFHKLCIQNRSGLLWCSDASWKSSALQGLQKSSGRIITIYVSINEGISREVQMHLGSFRLARFTQKVLGAFPWFLCPKAKLFAVKFKPNFDVFTLHALYKMLWTHFHNLCVQKRSCLPWSSDAFWKFSACKFYRKGSGRNSTICESKNEAVCCEVQTHFGSSLPASFTEKVLGAIPRFVCPKTKLFAVKLRHILEVICLQDLQRRLWVQFHDLCPKTKLFVVEFRRILKVLSLQILQKMFRAQFHDLCVQKQSCLLWNSDAFSKFSACEFYSKSSGHNSTICASKNESVCREIQMHFESSLLASFTKMLWVQFHKFYVEKWSCLLWNSGEFWSSRFARFMKNIQGVLSWFVRPKIELLAVMFRRIMELLRLQGLQRKFWTNFHDWCVQK